MSGYYVSPAGNDSAAGTIDAPWRTVQHAVASAAPGDVINLRAGSYAGGIFVNKPDVTIRSHPGERADASRPRPDGNNLWFYAAGGKALEPRPQRRLLRGEVRAGRRPGRRLQGHRDRLLRDQGRPRGRPRHHHPDRGRPHASARRHRRRQRRLLDDPGLLHPRHRERRHAWSRAAPSAS